MVAHTDYHFSADYWGPDGIYATASLPPLNLPAYRRLNPSSGAIEEIALGQMKPFPPVVLQPSAEGGSGGVGRIGRSDAEGRQLLVEGHRGDRSATITYYLSDGSATVFRGPWDPDGFDPNGVVFDGTRLWAVNYNGTSAWTWTASEGLVRFAVHDPPAQSIYVTTRAAGACV